MRNIVKASRRPHRIAHCRFARATGGGFPRLSDGVAHGCRCPASLRHALLAESPNLQAMGKPSLWVINKDLWYKPMKGVSGAPYSAAVARADVRQEFT